MIKIGTLLGAVGLALLALSFVSNANAPAAPSEAARGKALFQAKGCAACHAHAAVIDAQGRGSTAGPDLTSYRGDAGYLQRWLANPQAVKPDASMPNLNLSTDEIRALVAFLNEGE